MPSSDLNSVILIGRLTRDAELSYLQSGTPVASLSVAVNRSKKEGDQWVSEVNYFDVSYFGRGAESVRQYLTKGKQIAVQGALKQDRWEKDGQKFSKVRIVATSVELLGGRSDAGSNPNGGYQPRQSYSQPMQGAPAQQSYDAPMDNGDGFGGGDIEFTEDIPF